MKTGTPFSSNSTKALLLGSGELGKEVVIELQRLGVEVIAVDRYENAPAMQVAHRSYTISMVDGAALRAVIEKEKPDYIIPEIEAIDTSVLVEMEKEGYNVIPTARAVQLTMNREGIRRVAAETLHLKTSNYRFALSYEEYKKAIDELGIPFVIKPVMSSSGKGQSIVRSMEEIEPAWKYAQEGGRVKGGTKVIIEEFINFDYEITMLTVKHKGGTSFCEPVGHFQVDGDYRESWQPHQMSNVALKKAQDIAQKITDELGGLGLFGVELFVKGDEVYFSEVSPRPHDTGLVTIASQELSEFALHVRAILGLPIPEIKFWGPSASSVLLPEGVSSNIGYHNLEKVLNHPGTHLRLFGKPDISGKRRMGVVAVRAESVEAARQRAKSASEAVVYSFD